MPPRKKLRLEQSTGPNGGASVDVAALTASRVSDATSNNTNKVAIRRRKSSRSTAGQRSGAPSVPPAAAALHLQDPTPLLPDSAPPNQDADEADSTTTSSKTGFLSLPPEIRLMIYGFALDQNMDQKVRAISFPIWENYVRCKRTPRTLQLSLGNLANTCKILAREVRDFRAKLKPEQRCAAIEYSRRTTSLGDSLHIGYLHRAPCPIADMTDLEITFSITLRETAYGESLAGYFVSESRMALAVMFEYQHFAKFLKNATELRSLKLFISVEEVLTSEGNEELLKWFRDVVKAFTADMVQRHQREPFIRMNARVLRNVDLMDCSIKYR